MASNNNKKLTIQIKSKPTLPANYFETTWQSLSTALRAIRAHEPGDFGFSELYTFVEHLCVHKLGTQTYVALYRDIDAHLTAAFNKQWENTQTLPAAQFLQAFASFWHEHTEVMRFTRLIFTCLDRNQKQLLMQDQVPGSKSIWDLGLQVFKKHLLSAEHCLEKLVGDMLLVTDRERREGGDSVMMDVDTSLQNVLRMFFNLNMYTSHFEPRFLAETLEFYREESSQLLSSGQVTVAEYLVKCEQRLAEENKRAADFFDVTTRRPLRKSIEDSLIGNNVAVLVERGLDGLLQEHRLQDLNRMYRLFELVGQHDQALLTAFALNCKARGTAIVMGEEKSEMVPKVLELKQKLDEMVQESFESNPAFQRAVRTSFESFLNAGEDNRPAELIAKYIDRTLRSNTTSQPELEQQLTMSMSLFRFLHAKDVFEEFYKQCLAKRLLLGTSNSPDLERTMIANLKTECGSSFTSKLEGMMRDIDQSKLTSQAFQARTAAAAAATQQQQQVESTVQVLSMGFWPSFPDSPCTLPQELVEEKDRFTKFYAEKHEGRVLHWVNSLGRCTLKFHMEGKGKWDLDVSLFQAVVLLQFNANRAFTFKQLADSTLVSNEELVKTLSSLALGKKDQRVLVRTSKGTQSIFASTATAPAADNDNEEEEEEASLTSKLCHLDDVFQVNPQWHSKRSRLKINQIQIKETKKENDEAHKRVQGDRQYQIDAAIVRIMKSRKQLNHSLLVTELFKHLAFPAKPQDLKKRIESLIDREYLERDDNDANVYVYVA